MKVSPHQDREEIKENLTKNETEGEELAEFKKGRQP